MDHLRCITEEIPPKFISKAFYSRMALDKVFDSIMMENLYQ